MAVPVCHPLVTVPGMVVLCVRIAGCACVFDRERDFDWCVCVDDIVTLLVTSGGKERSIGGIVG